MAKALKTVAIVAGVAALAFTGVGLAAGLGVAATSFGIGVSASTLFLVAGAAGAAAQLLTKAPKVPSAQTDRLTANIDPRAFRKTVLGQTAMPVDVRYEEWSGTDQEYCDWIVCHASHAIDGLEEIWLNTELAWSQTTGVTAKYRGYFSVPNIVLEGSPANAFSFASGKWNGSTRLTGCAYSRLRFKVTGNSKKATSPFASGIPTRITVIGRGAKLYDPRRDSTVPGGSGPMRWNDQSTWRYTADDGAVIGENLALHVLRVVLGWRIRNPVTGEMRLATGSGVPGRRLQLQSWIESANLADELVNRSAGGQEPRYHGAGVVSEGDDPGTSLEALCASCNGRFRDTSGRLSFTIAHNDLAAAATDEGLLDDDVVGGHTWDPDPALDGTPNVVRGQYVDPTPGSLYQLVDYPEVRLPSPDGQDRVLVLNLGVCESPSQAQRIAKQVLQRKQYQREFTAPFDIRAWKYQVGSILPFTYAPLSFNRALFRVKAQEHGQGGTCNMTLVAEHAAIYLWDRDDAAPVQAAEPIAYDATRNPLVLAIADLDGLVTQIFSDGVITHGREKRDLVRQWQALEAQFLALDGRYAALGSPGALSAARDQAYARYRALASLLAGLVPAWDDINADTPVDASALGTAWASAREKLELFAAAITGLEGPAGKDGGGAFTLLNLANLTIAGNVATKTSGGDDWNGKGYTLESGSAVRISAMLPPGSFVGLTTDPTASVGFDTIDYAAYRSSNPDYGYGAFRNGGSAMNVATPIAPGQVLFSVEAKAGFIIYERSGVEYHRHPANAPDEDLYGVIEIAPPGAAVMGVTFAVNGAAGQNAYSILSDNEAHTVAADAAGNVYDYGDASFTVAIYHGAQDVTSSFRLASTVNPQNLAGVSAHPEYSITSGFDANEATASVTYNFVGIEGTPHIGILLSTTFSLSKSRDGAAGGGGAAAPLIRVSATPQAIRYNRDDVIDSGDVVFDATLINAMGPVSWSSAVGHGIFNRADMIVEAFRLTLKQSRMDEILRFNEANGHGRSETIIASASGVSDRITVTKIRDGATGNKGDNAPAISISPASSQLRVGKDGNYIGGQGFSLNVTRVNLAGTPIFTRNDGYANTAAGYAAVDPGSFSTTGPDNLTISPTGAVANMNALGGAAGRIAFTASVPGFEGTATAEIKAIADGADGKDGQPGAPGSGISKPTVSAKPNGNWNSTSWTLVATTPELTITGGSIGLEAFVRYGGASGLRGATGQLSVTIARSGGPEQQVGQPGAVGARVTPAQPGGDPESVEACQVAATTGTLTAGSYVGRLYIRGDNNVTGYLDPSQSALVARNN